jgi:hypothetical protein
VFSQKPVSGDGDFTFTRASAATRVNADGNIEKETINLFRYSEEFNQGSAWSKQGGAQISPNASTAPDGTNTADLLYPSISGVVKAAIQSFTSASGTQYAQSIYVKASGKNFAALYALNGSAGPAMWVNLTTGAITNGSTPNVVGRFATSVGDGWWRIGFADLGNGTIGYMHIYPTDTAGSQNVTANGTDGILIWGGQLNYGSVAQEYIKTTTAAVYGGITDNTPRLDYTDSSCPALLLEPQRTNLVPHSEYFNSWIIQSGTSVFSNTTETLSPEGLYNAAKVTSNGANGLFPSAVAGGGGVNTKSIYLKGVNGGESVYIKDPYETITSKLCVLTTEWQRFEMTETQTNQMSIWISNIPSGGIYMWGAQLEQNASYATSYIPTYGSSVTRVAESNSVTGVSDLIGQTEGTMYVEFEHNIVSTTEDTRFILSDNSYNNWIFFSIENGTSLRYYITSGGVNELDATATNVFPSVGRYKVALAYEDDLLTIYVNGVQKVNNTTSTNIPAMSAFLLSGKEAVTSAVELVDKQIHQALLFKTRLTNEELAALTTI